MGLTLNVRGWVFGNLTAIAPVRTNKHGWVVWDTVCTCGKHKEVPLPRLRTGKTTSCGPCGRKRGWTQKRVRNVQDGMFTCSGCRQRLPLSVRAGRLYQCLPCKREAANIWCKNNRERLSSIQSDRYAKNPAKYLLHTARGRAKRRGLEFNITEDDIPMPPVCPVLGISFDANRGVRAGKRGFPSHSSPTLDRIDNSKGYVKGNVRIISWRANSLKKDGTVAEFTKLVAWMKEQGL